MTKPISNFAVLRLVCTVLIGTTNYGWTADEVSLAGQYGEPHVVIAAPDDVSIAHAAWPKVICTPNGTIIVAAISGEFHGTHGGGCPIVATSTDGGKTFGEPVVLKRYNKRSKYTSAGNCAIGVAEDGAVVLMSMAYNGNATSTIDGWRSIDSGKTWTAIDVSTLDRSQTGSVFGNVILVPGKGLAVFGHYRVPTRKENGGLWMAWSRDHGKSWEAPQSVEINTKLRLTEPAVTYADGRFIGLIRCNQDHYVQITSDDDGKTWEAKIPGLKSDSSEPLMLPSPCLIPDPHRSGRLLALVSERHNSKAESGLYGRIVMWEAQADQLDWKMVGEVARFPRELEKRHDITYAWLTSLNADRGFAVFYCGQTRGPSDIYGLELPLP